MIARTIIVILTALLAVPAMVCAQTRAKPVAAGELAPDFTLVDQNGRSHALSAERGKRAVVLVFYRGYW